MEIYLTFWKKYDIISYEFYGGIFMNKELANRLCKLISEKGIVKSELANDIGVSPSALSKYLSGDLEPNSRVLANLATALEVTVDFLLGIEKAKLNPMLECQRVFMRNRESLTDEDRFKLMNIISKHYGRQRNEN